MNQYKRLLNNTMIFALGTFSSKFLVFLMTRYYTSVMTSAQFGDADLIISTCNIIIPLASVGIASAVIRFALDKGIDKQKVFSIGVITVLLGFLCILPIAPFLYRLSFIDTNVFLVYCYVLVSSLQSICAQFIRGLGHVKLYALNGVFRTVMVILFNVLFLSGFKFGIQGYVLSVICSDAVAIILLFWIENLGQYFNLRSFDKGLTSQMLHYSLPLVPTTICSWVIGVSDRYFVRFFFASSLTGLYSASYKVPTMLTYISTFFIDAWQISIVNDNSKEEQEEFFSKVGNTYQALLFLMASGIVMTCKIITVILVSPAFYECWRYMPILVFGITFYCLANFQNSIYTLYKKTTLSMWTVVICAALNLGLNALLIPTYGANGASVATLISYFIMFLIRAVHSRKFLIIHWKIKRFIATTVLLAVQILFMLHEGHYWIPIQITLFATICLLNAGDILLGIKKILRKA